MTLLERDAGEGVRRENIRRDLRDRQRVVLDDEDTRDAPAQKRQSDLGRAGSRCYLRDAAHGCAHNGGTTRRNAHTTRCTRMCGVCMGTHEGYVRIVN